MTKRKPIRVFFTHNDPAELWREGDTADDLGPEAPGSSAHVFRLDGFDASLVVLDDPYGRGIVERLHPPEVEPEKDIPFEGENPDPADRCARCSHIAYQHQSLTGSCGACGCRKFLEA